MKIAVLGIGKVGFALANSLQHKGHELIIAHDDPQSESVVKAMDANPNLQWAPIQEAIDRSDAVLLALPFMANEEVLGSVKFDGQTLIDCTNPVGPGISHGLNSTSSGSEMVQLWAPGAHVVKAFTIYGYENLEGVDDTVTPKTVMPLVGDHTESKELVSQLILDLGFEPLDCGSLDRALHLEHMTLLWVKMVRMDGHSPDFTWSYVSRT